MAHVTQAKEKVVSEITALLDEYPVIGMVNMNNLPAKQLQSMRVTLRSKNTVLRMTKKRLMKIAFEKSKKSNIKDMEKYFEGLPALIFTKENPFKLYTELDKAKSKAPAKAGQVAPNDITVSAGPTSFTPGPIISQLGKFGVKAGVEGGKIAIKADAVVAKKGDVINAELAGILARLGVEPMEIGLNLVTAYEDGQYYEADVLHVDTEEYFSKFSLGRSNSFNLAVYSAYTTSDTVEILLSKAHNDAKSLAISNEILTSDTTEDILKKAYFQMLSLSGNLSDDAKSNELKQAKPAQAEQPAAESKEQENKPKEDPAEKQQEDAASGLGALFG